MTERQRQERLNDAIEGLLHGQAGSTGDADLDALTRFASSLRDLPDPAFRERLRDQLVRRPRFRPAFFDWLPGRGRSAGGARRPVVFGSLAFAGAGAAAVFALVFSMCLLPSGGDDGERAERPGPQPTAQPSPSATAPSSDVQSTERQVAAPAATEEPASAAAAPSSGAAAAPTSPGAPAPAATVGGGAGAPGPSAAPAGGGAGATPVPPSPSEEPPPPLPEEGEQAFGLLPMPGVIGGVGGGEPPLFGGLITYRLSGEIALPTSAPVHRLHIPEVTAERVEEIARRLGIDGNVKPLSERYGGGYEAVSTAEHCIPNYGCLPLRELSMDLDGRFWYSDNSVVQSPPAPSEQEAIATATTWVRQAGLIEGELASVRAGPADENEAPEGRRAQRPVVFELTAQSHPALDRPYIQVDVGSGGVSHANGLWATIGAQAPYPLHSIDQVLRDLDDLRGVFDHLGRFGASTGLPADVIDRTKDAVVTVESVEVLYGRVAADGQAYLAPVYLVHGRLIQAGLAEPVPLGIWIPAMDAAAGTASHLSPTAAKTLFVVARELPVYPGAHWPDPRDPERAGSPIRLLLGRETESALHLLYPGIYGVVFEGGAAGAVDFYRQALPARGWQREEPPVVERLAGTYPGDAGLDPAQYSNVASFVKDDVRVAVLGREVPADPDPARFSISAYTDVEIVVSLRSGAAQRAPPRAGATYEGSIVADAGCGGGTIRVVVGPEGNDIRSVSITGFNDGQGHPVSGSATFDPGAVPIAGGGFTVYFTVYFTTAGGSFDVSGAFDGDRLAGRVSLVGSLCVNEPFTAQVAGVTAAATAVPTTAPSATGAAAPLARSLPSAGTGSGRPTGAAPWTLVAGALAALGLGAGLAVRRRRSCLERERL